MPCYTAFTKTCRIIIQKLRVRWGTVKASPSFESPPSGRSDASRQDVSLKEIPGSIFGDKACATDEEAQTLPATPSSQRAPMDSPSPGSSQYPSFAGVQNTESFNTTNTTIQDSFNSCPTNTTVTNVSFNLICDLRLCNPLKYQKYITSFQASHSTPPEGLKTRTFDLCPH
ncbi:LOW QUALITY PROTEIN: hypothetical protein CVT26_016018 [Gymnopilus dilepis]|uniref:Uncharacterized protein n=1 Tax=Gymnopilus dilepis TaxID=231916 RepID=A0A409YDJ5_9AGAR|nr:LOW QUALITY PROTEIN: hypothetical protein CVT26_016018 [Gymnopilus dilepis]